MSSHIEVMVIVEGKTEEIFITSLLAPYMAEKNIFMRATQASKPGQKGGDIRFERVKNDIGHHLKQRSDTYVTTLIDYYGVREWPGIHLVPERASSRQISEIVNSETKRKVVDLFSGEHAERRFIPYIAIHEFEALHFSDSKILADALQVSEAEIIEVLNRCGDPEEINNSPETAPSKRLDKWCSNGRFPKTTVGIAIVRSIGVSSLREKCPLFNAWLESLEAIVGGGSVD